MTKPVQVDLIPAGTAEKLEARKRRIETFIAAGRKASAEFFGYRFLAGREMLLAKDDLPHGNANETKAGLKNWIGASFPAIAYRTAARWMVFADLVLDKAATLPPLKKRPLLLGNKRVGAKDRETILKTIPLLLDGKGMLEFMRAEKLLRDAQKPKHHPVKPLSPDEAVAAKAKLAKRHWAAITNDLVLGEDHIAALDSDIDAMASWYLRIGR